MQAQTLKRKFRVTIIKRTELKMTSRFLFGVNAMQGTKAGNARSEAGKER